MDRCGCLFPSRDGVNGPSRACYHISAGIDVLDAGRSGLRIHSKSPIRVGIKSLQDLRFHLLANRPYDRIRLDLEV